MRPPTTPPARVPTCGTCTFQHRRYAPTFSTHRPHDLRRTTCTISHQHVSPYMTACPLYERQITPIPPT